MPRPVRESDDENLRNDQRQAPLTSHPTTSTVFRRPMTAGSSRTATTAPQSEQQYLEQVAKNRRFTAPSQQQNQQNYRNESANVNQQFFDDEEDHSNDGNEYNNEEYQDEESYNNNNNNNSRQQYEQASSTLPSQMFVSNNTRRGSTQRAGSQSSNTNNPNSVEVTAFQRTLQMLAKLQQIDHSVQFNNNTNQNQSKRRPQSASRLGRSSSSIASTNTMPPGNNFENNNNNNNNNFVTNQQMQRPLSARGAPTRNEYSNHNHHHPHNQKTQVDEDFDRMFPNASAVPNFNIAPPASSSSVSRFGNIHNINRIHSKSSNNNMSNDTSTISTAYQQQQPSPMRNPNLFLEQTQAELERVANEKHQLQRLVIELQKENEDLKNNQELILSELEMARMGQNTNGTSENVQNVKPEIYLQDGEYLYDEPQQQQQEIDIEEEGNYSDQIISKTQQDSTKQHFHLSSNSSLPSSNAALEKAMFVITRNFPSEITESLYHPKLEQDDDDHDDETNNSERKVNLDELVNFLADRCIELCAARQQLTHDSHIHQEMQNLADDWERRENELCEEIENLQTQVFEQEFEIEELKLLLNSSSSNTPRSTSSTSSNKTSTAKSSASYSASAEISTTKDILTKTNSVLKNKLDHSLQEVKKSMTLTKKSSAISKTPNTSSSSQHQQTTDLENLLREVDVEVDKMIQHQHQLPLNSSPLSQKNQQSTISLVENNNNNQNGCSDSSSLFIPSHHWSNQPYRALSSVMCDEKKNNNAGQKKMEDLISTLIRNKFLKSASNNNNTHDKNQNHNISDFDSLELWSEIVNEVKTDLNFNKNVDSLILLEQTRHLVLVETCMLVAELWGIVLPENDEYDNNNNNKLIESFFVTENIPNSALSQYLLKSTKDNTNPSTSIGLIDRLTLRNLFKVISKSYSDNNNNNNNDASSSTPRKEVFHSSFFAANVVAATFFALQFQHETAIAEEEEFHEEFSQVATSDGSTPKKKLMNTNSNNNNNGTSKNTSNSSSAFARFDSSNNNSNQNHHQQEEEEERYIYGKKNRTEVEEEADRRRMLLKPSILHCMNLEELLALLLSAASISIGHPNVTESFLIKTRDAIAVRYSTSSSILANYHTATLLSLDEAVCKLMTKSEKKNGDTSSTTLNSIIFASSSNNSQNEEIEQQKKLGLLQNFHNLVITFLGVANNNNHNRNANSATSCWNFLADVWNNGNINVQEKYAALVVATSVSSTDSASSINENNNGSSVRQNLVTLVSHILAGAKSKCLVLSSSDSQKNKKLPWISILRQDCANQVKLEKEKYVDNNNNNNFSQQSSDVVINTTSSYAAELRSIVWLVDSQLIPPLCLADAILNSIYEVPTTITTSTPSKSRNDTSFVSLEASTTEDADEIYAASSSSNCTLLGVEARNYFANQGNMPLFAEDYKNRKSTRDRVEKQVMIKTTSSPAMGIHNVDNRHNNKAEKSFASREEVESMKWSFGEIQKSLLQTISEYQDALSVALEDKKILAESTTEMIQLVTERRKTSSMEF